MSLGFFVWLEATAPSVWIRESPSLLGFPFILYLHTLGLALLAGLSSAVALGILLIKPRPALYMLLPLFPLMWLGFGINAASGLALLLAYPAKALTNPVFYLKLIAIAGAIGIVHWLRGQLTGQRAAAAESAQAVAAAVNSRAEHRAAWSLLSLWLIATLTGRLLAYTYSILLASFPGVH